MRATHQGCATTAGSIPGLARLDSVRAGWAGKMQLATRCGGAFASAESSSAGVRTAIETIALLARDAARLLRRRCGVRMSRAATTLGGEASTGAAGDWPRQQAC
jgi:hypothetical protein